MKHGSVAWPGIDWKQRHRWWALNTVQPSGGLRGQRLVSSCQLGEKLLQNRKKLLHGAWRLF